MGCDIHAMIEEKKVGSYYSWWINRGDPEIDRYYELFSVLGNVRNYNNIPFIAENRGVDAFSCCEYLSWIKYWDSDAHSASWVTLKELKDFNIEQEYYNSNLIKDKDNAGKIIETCTFTTGKHMGEVGKVKLFRVFGEDSHGIKDWRRLIKKLDSFGSSPENIRIVFFFDN